MLYKGMGEQGKMCNPEMVNATWRPLPTLTQCLVGPRFVGPHYRETATAFLINGRDF